MGTFKNYIFDLGGVIADISIQNALDGFRTLGVPEEELNFDTGATAKIMQNYQLGFLTTDEFCDAIIERCRSGAIRKQAANQQLNRKQVADAWNFVILHIPQEKMEALRSLKKQANVYLLSNTNELHWQKCLDLWFNANGNHIEDFFHHVFLSQDMHLEKPDPEIFRQAIHKIETHQNRGEAIPVNEPINATNTVFLDDNAANVTAAQSCGISAIHVTPNYDWITELV